MKEKFLNNEFWTLTFGAAFQRANVYKDNVTDTEKGEFKTKTRAFIENELLNHYSNQVSDELHIENINKLSEFTKQFQNILQNGKLNFGVSQKMLNLYLKYLWCSNKISEPPHFPVDRIIQVKLLDHSKQTGITSIGIEAWTKFNDEKHYLKVINSARELIHKNENFKSYSLAKLELELFDRR